MLVVSHLYVATDTYAVKSLTIQVTKLTQIVPINDAYVRPLLYTHVNGLSELTIPEAKATFLSAVLPAVLVAKHDIETLRYKLRRLSNDDSWNEKDSALFRDAAMRFRKNDLHDLVESIGALPTSLVLAQAAVESGLGTIPFFSRGQ